ncbi:hypothetical protein ILT44_00295 [Microvirga sp. BT689]|uniref:hypothetical protein n=1 Tax=Microvirga arvi TaxID=2778731 RepID=UPI001950499F|nr:hypothetical protein [Microvirga arvi]MBM6578603.1 hypothetical protein [Microvirga arvi]
MGAPIQRLWHHIAHWPLFNVLGGHDPASKTPAPDALDDVPVTFKDNDGDCEPTAGQIEAMERERAERFKRDQLLPIMGWSTGVPG